MRTLSWATSLPFTDSCHTRTRGHCNRADTIGKINFRARAGRSGLGVPSARDPAPESGLLDIHTVLVLAQDEERVAVTGKDLGLVGGLQIARQQLQVGWRRIGETTGDETVVMVTGRSKH